MHPLIARKLPVDIVGDSPWIVVLEPLLTGMVMVPARWLLLAAHSAEAGLFHPLVKSVCSGATTYRYCRNRNQTPMRSR